MIILTADDPRLGKVSPDGLVYPKQTIDSKPIAAREQVNTMYIDGVHFYAMMAYDRTQYEVSVSPSVASVPKITKEKPADG